jgi:hypothetical protein
MIILSMNLHDHRSLEKENELSADEWTSVLRLSDLWDMHALRLRSIARLEVILAEEPHSRFAIAKRFQITHWLLPALVQLVQRAPPIGVEESKQLGDLELSFKICAIRECCRQYWNSYSVHPDRGAFMYANDQVEQRVRADCKPWLE